MFVTFVPKKTFVIGAVVVDDVYENALAQKVMKVSCVWTFQTTTASNRRYPKKEHEWHRWKTMNIVVHLFFEMSWSTNYLIDELIDWLVG